MDHRDVSYLLYEATQARHERTTKRLIIALIVAITLIFASNAIWLYAWMQYDYVSEETMVDIDSKYGPANYIGNDGDIYNGQSESNEAPQD